MTAYRFDKTAGTVFAHVSLKDARSFGNTFDTFDNVGDLQNNKNISLTDLVNIYNMHKAPDAPNVAKFADKTAAARRVFAALEAKFTLTAQELVDVVESKAPVAEAPPVVVPEAPTPRASVFNKGTTETVVVKKETLKQAVQKVLDKKQTGRKKGSGKFAGKQLFPLVAENPRRAGSFGYHSMSLILAVPGLYYSTYIEKGGRPQDLQWDIDRKFVEVK